MAMLALPLVSMVVGCATRFEETYYVGVYRKESNQPLQLYRFRMKGHADFGSKVKYESGWFPAKALQEAVGESRDVPSPEESNVFVVGPEGEAKVLKNQRLVVFMATDPSPMTNSIQNWARAMNDQTTAMKTFYEQRRQARVDRQKQRAKNNLAAFQALVAAEGPTNTSIGRVNKLIMAELSVMAGVSPETDTSGEANPASSSETGTSQEGN